MKAFGKFVKDNPNEDYRLVLAGSPGHNYDEIRRYIDEYNISSHVIETGWVEEEDLPSLYNGSIAFVFPSFYEGFGLPLLEAMSCGTPIIASNVASIPEVAQGSALLFDPNNTDDIKRAMEDISGNIEKRNELVEKGFKRVKDFSWEKCAMETLKEIERINL